MPCHAMQARKHERRAAATRAEEQEKGEAELRLRLAEAEAAVVATLGGLPPAEVLQLLAFLIWAGRPPGRLPYVGAASS